MLTSRAEAQTPMARRYMKQLCKHFAHKIEAEAGEDAGYACFDFGKARMRADDATLTLIAEAETPETLTRVQEVIEDHLLRFAFRETLGPLGWTRVEG